MTDAWTLLQEAEHQLELAGPASMEEGNYRVEVAKVKALIALAQGVNQLVDDYERVNRQLGHNL
jgi:hypothetical protein